jgi:uncharacterized RDD family membrane protein YckC
MEFQSIRCWIAPRDLLQNTDYANASVKAIENCYIMVVVLSFSSNDSPIIIRDLNKAVTQKLSIISYRIDDVIPSKPMKYLLGGTHEMDAIDGRMLPSLTSLVQHILSDLHDGKREKKEIFLINAGLWERFGAGVIDGIIMLLLPFFLIWILQFYIPLTTGGNINDFAFGFIFAVLIDFSYFTVTEASRWRGTFGKKVCNLVVTTTTNERASVFRILVRNMVKWSTIFFLGIPFLIAIVTPNKQALYDLISGTVVQKNPVTWQRYKNIEKDNQSE